MNRDFNSSDRVIAAFKNIVDELVQKLSIELVSLVLYGSKARGDRNSNNDYEILILVRNDISLRDYIKFNERLKMELVKEKLLQVKFIVYSPETFEELMYKDEMAGTLLYIICRENIILFDKQGVFSAIKERVARNDLKDEEEFINQCISFAKMMGSEKWQRKYEKTLLQFKYTKRRRSV